MDIIQPQRRFVSEHELVYAEGIAGLKEQKVVVCFCDGIGYLCLLLHFLGFTVLLWVGRC